MNEMLLEAFRHSAWAKNKLLVACESVSAEDLARPGPGVGSILATLNHLVVSDARYVSRLDGGPRPGLDEEKPNDLRELLALAEETRDRWQRYLQGPVDGERLVTLDEGAYETHVAVVVMQALHHVCVHGEQVCARLSALGAERPDLQPWAFADETGRSRWLRPQE